VGKIINDSAELGLMLHRSWQDLYENMRDFQVAVEDDKVVGVCGLKIVWANWAEVYALAVDTAYRGKGIGRKLVLTCVDEGENLGIRNLMTLTYEREFFLRCGFAVVDRMTLPMKVWSECLKCPKNKACDEIAMVRTLDVPEVTGPSKPADPSPTTFEVPVQLGIHAAKAKLNAD
jgi:amino-acid N-acetyltransferase